MIRQASARNRPRQRFVFTLLALLALVAALAGGDVLWQRLHEPVYRHTPNAINTGASVLYLSSPGFSPAPTLLTMVRTRDGVALWHYTLPPGGTLSTGAAPTIGEALASNQAVAIADGVVYFVVDPNHLGSPDREQELTALRASDGAQLWRRAVRGATVEMFGVSDGVVCLRITQQQGSRVVSSALAGYNARTGSFVWQRQGSDATGSPSVAYGVSLLDGILYVTGGGGASPSSSALYALLARTGETLWRYAPPAPPGARAGQLAASLVSPVTVDDGVVVLSTTSGYLIGIRERDGVVLWRYQAPNLVVTIPHGGANAPGIQEQGGTLYFGTTAADTGLQLNSLQVTTGSLLWHTAIGAADLVLWDLAVGGGRVYALVAPPGGPHPSFDELALFAVDAGSGTLRWQQHPAGKILPYVAAAGDVVLLASTTSLAGLNAAEGAPLWRISLAQPSVVAPAAYGIAILASVVSSGPETWAGSLCAVQQATGTMRWCDQFVTGLAAVVLGP